MTTASSATETNLAKFQVLLRELFQFDCADLDFGIYRIMNYKRDVVEQFITEKLPAVVASELDSGPLAEQARAQSALEDAAQRVRDNLAPDAIDGLGNLSEQYHGTQAGRDYLTAQTNAADGSRSRDAVEAEIYNHLWTFFSRYYEEGDFISKRRYSRNERYAIPYNGEEVYLHWANSDQYYVKTDEHFRNYDWKAPNGVTVRFRLDNANVEQNNVKGDDRLFLPLCDKSQWDADSRAITIPFEYRPLNDAEKQQYGKGRQKQQDNIIAGAITKIQENLPQQPDALAALAGEHRRNGNDSVSYLEHHLRRYVARNNADFFVHKNLFGFLNRELDFYLKNEVLNLDHMTTAGQHLADGWFQTLRLVKEVGSRVIDFLAQIENFQKTLYEKRKFVTETRYCVTLGNIDATFYAEIVANDEQWQEWGELFGIDGTDPSEEFLETHPTLVLDTKHFDAGFTDRLLASFDDLDSITDGEAIRSENWQALNLARFKYAGLVKSIHIDPPYNPRSDAFIYKNGYPNSTWLAMLRDRIVAGYSLMQPDGFLLCHIDEIEYEKLQLLLEGLGVPDVGTLVWDKRNPMTGGGGIATQHEYVICRSNSDRSMRLHNDNSTAILDKAEAMAQRVGGLSEESKREFARWVTSNADLTGGEKAYRFIDDNGKVYSSVSLRAPERRSDPKFFEPLIHPTTGKPCPVPPNGFSRTPDTLKGMVGRGEILFGNDENTQPRQKRYLQRGSKRQLSSVVQDATRGKTFLDALGLDDFPYCHSVSFYETILGTALADPGDSVLDYFAGSGTTGHAIINLNREDGGERKFILVEMGQYFDTVLLPRIKKVTYSPEWRDGKPQRPATAEETERSPRIVKYVRLESYEDALDSIEFDQIAGDAQQRWAEADDEYLLKYMLRWEAKDSATLLNVGNLNSPYNYRLRAHVNGEKRERKVDLPETFNYLLGLNVRTRQAYDDDGRHYLVYRGETREAPNQSVAVIWRETESWSELDFDRDRDFVAECRLAADADTVYVNGDSCIPNARPIEPIFEARMFAGVDA